MRRKKVFSNAVHNDFTWQKETAILNIYWYWLAMGSKPWFVCVCVCVCVCAHVCAHAHTLRHVWLFSTPWTVACWAPLSMEFFRQEYWSRLPFPTPGDLSDPGVSPALAGGFFTTSAIWDAMVWLHINKGQPCKQAECLSYPGMLLRDTQRRKI